MLLKLQRVTLTNNSPTFGVLINHDIPLCLTLERPWLNNTKSLSCIPEGTYMCVRFNSQKHGKTWEITGVKDRTSILFHAGNTINDSEGCVLTGLAYGGGGISHSKDGMEALRRTLPEEFTLEVINPKGELNGTIN